MKLDVLSRYSRRDRLPAAGEQCELCAMAIGAEHSHVVDLESRRLCCACRPCALLFERPGSGAGRYRTVPDRVLVDPELALTHQDWQALGIPVRLAYVFLDSGLGRWVAQYPSPAGPTDAEVDPEAWAALGARTALVGHLAPDVEALLVRGRRGEPRLEAYLAPIDACYELVGHVRRRWRGFDGGDAARQAIDGFFARLSARSRAMPRRAP